MSNVSLFVINGVPRSGKDTFADLVKAINCSSKEVVNISSVDDVKTAYRMLGWNGTKTPEDRKNLSIIKGIADSRFNYTVEYIVDFVKKNHKEVVYFYHVRELENINNIKKALRETGLEVKSVYVDRGLVTEASNSSDIEAGLDAQSYDILIDNSGTKMDLIERAKEFCEMYLDIC